jgi:hypothetical protein
MTYSYNPSGGWTATHLMTLNGKRDAFVMGDVRTGRNSPPREKSPDLAK